MTLRARSGAAWTTFGSTRHPLDQPFSGDLRPAHWRADTPFGPAGIHQAKDPARTVVSGTGLPPAALLERGGGYVPVRRRPLTLEVDGTSGEVDTPYVRFLSLQLTRGSRTVRAQLPDGVWFLHAAGFSSIVLEREGVALARSDSSFRRHSISPDCSPLDLAVHLALSPMRTDLFVLMNLA